MLTSPIARQIWLGITPPQGKNSHLCLHCPLIKTQPLAINSELLEKWPSFTHLLLTSKEAVRYLLAALKHHGIDTCSLRHKQLVTVGKATASLLTPYVKESEIAIAKHETAEGVCALLSAMDLKNSYLLWPHASGARAVIGDYLQQRGVQARLVPLYETLFSAPPSPLPLDSYDELVFTSPSCVDAFLHFFGPLPRDKRLKAIGPITEAHLHSHSHGGCNISQL